MKVSGMLFYVSFKRDEILVDKGGSLLVTVRLGFQPSTGASRRGCAEINKQRFS
jgi:hypothetical protein